MSIAVQASPLRLPTGQARPAGERPGDGPRAWLEELARRRFSGRVTLQNDAYLSELLVRGGQPLAATLAGRDEPIRSGQAALNALTGLPVGDWGCQVEPLEPSLLAALAGLGTEPEVCPLKTVAGLRALLRDLAQRGENGVLELSAAAQTDPSSEASNGRWARALLAEGRLLGAYSESEPTLAASLAPLAGLLAHPLIRVNWFPSTADTLMIPPAVEAVEGSAVAVERQVIWLVSRFESDWGRARERSAPVDALQESLARLLGSLLELAGALEEHRDDPTTLEAILADPLEAEQRSLSDLDPRLAGLAAARACPILLELTADALQRIVLVFPDANLTECCRQAALALQAELRAVLPAPAPSTVGADAS